MGTSACAAAVPDRSARLGWTRVFAVPTLLVLAALLWAEPKPDDPPREAPASVTVGLAELAEPKQERDPWDQQGNVIFTDALTIELGRTWRPRTLDVSVDHNDTYVFDFSRGGALTGSVSLPTSEGDPDAGGLVVRTIALPPSLADEGADRVVVTAPVGDHQNSVGHFVLTE